MDDISNMRAEIDSIDEKLVELFEKRMETVLRVAEYKKDNNMNVLDRSRENEVIKKAVVHLKNSKFEKPVVDFMTGIMKISRSLEHQLISGIEVETANDKD